MKKKLTSVALLVVLCMGCWGCGQAENEVLEQTEEMNIEEMSTEVIPLEDKEYSNISITFQYPGDWELGENRGEDGAAIKVFDPKHPEKEIVRLEQGEDWHINLSATEADYYDLYERQYPGIQIQSLTSMTIDGCDAKRLEFTYVKDGKDYKVLRYMVIDAFVSFDFICEVEAELFAEYEPKILAIIDSVNLTVSENFGQ